MLIYSFHRFHSAHITVAGCADVRVVILNLFLVLQRFGHIYVTPKVGRGRWGRHLITFLNG